MKDEAFGIVPILRQADGDRFLLVQHRSGHWGFPKGHANPGESAIATACRELEEETGIKVDDLPGNVPFVEQYSFVKKGRTVQKTVVYFVAFVESADVTCQEEEIQAYVWLTFEAASEKVTFAQGKQVLGEVQAYLSQTERTESSEQKSG
jgi:bis(5'-nucleosidyl)-tetraphosphatase